MIKMIVLVCLLGDAQHGCTFDVAISSVRGPDYTDVRTCQEHADIFERDDEVVYYSTRRGRSILRDLVAEDEEFAVEIVCRSRAVV